MKDYSIIWLVSKPLNLFKLFSRIYYKVYIARDNVNIDIAILNTFMAFSFEVYPKALLFGSYAKHHRTTDMERILPA
jgi:hypothetical protein